MQMADGFPAFDKYPGTAWWNVASPGAHAAAFIGFALGALAIGALAYCICGRRGNGNKNKAPAMELEMV